MSGQLVAGTDGVEGEVSCVVHGVEQYSNIVLFVLTSEYRKHSGVWDSSALHGCG